MPIFFNKLYKALLDPEQALCYRVYLFAVRYVNLIYTEKLYEEIYNA